MKSFLASFGRALLTLVVVLVAILAGWELWSYYMLEPWTRNTNRSDRGRQRYMMSRP